jgi:hypothetical protein
MEDIAIAERGESTAYATNDLDTAVVRTICTV